MITLDKLLERYQRERERRQDIFTFLKTSIGSGHTILDIYSYKTIGKRYKNNDTKHKNSEALLMKEMKATLNNQEYLVKLKRLN